MNKTTQYHIGSILVALSAFGQHLMGAAPAEVETPPAEPTTDKPKGAGRPRKEAVTPPAEKPAETPSEKPGFTWEQLKEIGRPLMTAASGQLLKDIIKKHMPKGGDPDKGLRELANYPEVHAAFKADVEAASY